MEIILEKDGIERKYTLIDGKVQHTFKIGNEWVCNPTLEYLLQNGWRLVE